MVPGLYAAVTRQDAKGWPEGGWHPEERVTAEEALRMFSADAAFAAFEEDGPRRDRGRQARRPHGARAATRPRSRPRELLKTQVRDDDGGRRASCTRRAALTV